MFLSAENYFFYEQNKIVKNNNIGEQLELFFFSAGKIFFRYRKELGSYCIVGNNHNCGYIFLNFHRL